MNHEFHSNLKQKIILLEITAPFTLQKNDKIKRDNKIVVESARTMLINVLNGLAKS